MCCGMPGAIGEIARKQAHHERPGDVHDEGAEWKSEAEQLRGADIDPVTKRSADSGADENNQIEHKPPTARKCASRSHRPVGGY